MGNSNRPTTVNWIEGQWMDIAGWGRLRDTNRLEQLKGMNLDCNPSDIAIHLGYNFINRFFARVFMGHMDYYESC